MAAKEKSFSRVIGRLCKLTQKTSCDFSHGGFAAGPRLVKTSTTGAAICTLGASKGRLNASLEIQIRAETGSTLHVDSVSPVKFLPHKVGCEYGIGIHANVEDDALLVITPEAHVPHLDAQSGLWTRYDLSPGSSLVSVQLADLRNQAARPPTVGGRYTSRTRIHHAGGYQASDGEESAEGEPLNDAREGFVASDSLGHISTSCALPSTSSCGRAFAAEPSWQCDWTYGRRFKGLVMGTPTTNVIASIIISGPRSLPVSEKFRDLEGRHSHRAIGLLGDVHLAIQEKQLPSGAFTVVRAATEGRDDMHRLLHHCLSPLQSALGHSPYGRYIRKSEKTTEQRMGTLFSPPFYVEDPSVEVDLAEPEATKEPPGLHIQRTS